MRKSGSKRKPAPAKKRKPAPPPKPRPGPPPPPPPPPTPPKGKGPIQHVVIIFKENHTFDNYFGRFKGADGEATLPLAPDPPASDHAHDHATWLKRATVAASQQYD